MGSGDISAFTTGEIMYVTLTMMVGAIVHSLIRWTGRWRVVFCSSPSPQSETDLATPGDQRGHQ